MQPRNRRMMPLLTLLSVTMLAGCGISQPLTVEGLSDVIGDALPGARGETLADQDKIDATIARGCAAGVFTREKCDLHTKASAERRGN